MHDSMEITITETRFAYLWTYNCFNGSFHDLATNIIFLYPNDGRHKYCLP